MQKKQTSQQYQLLLLKQAEVGVELPTYSLDRPPDQSKHRIFFLKSMGVPCLTWCHMYR